MRTGKKRENDAKSKKSHHGQSQSILIKFEFCGTIFLHLEKGNEREKKSLYAKLVRMCNLP